MKIINSIILRTKNKRGNYYENNKYHVPDISKGLSEVNRVLKDGGYFYCATYGENRIADYIANLIGIEIDEDDKVFTLQNSTGEDGKWGIKYSKGIWNVYM